MMKQGQISKGQYVIPFTITLPDKEYVAQKLPVSINVEESALPVVLSPSFSWSNEAGECLSVKWML